MFITILFTHYNLEGKSAFDQSSKIEANKDLTLRELVIWLVENMHLRTVNTGNITWLLKHNEHILAVIFPLDRKAFYLHSSLIPLSTLCHDDEISLIIRVILRSDSSI